MSVLPPIHAILCQQQPPTFTSCCIYPTSHPWIYSLAYCPSNMYLTSHPVKHPPDLWANSLWYNIWPHTYTNQHSWSTPTLYKSVMLPFISMDRALVSGQFGLVTNYGAAKVTHVGQQRNVLWPSHSLWCLHCSLFPVTLLPALSAITP